MIHQVAPDLITAVRGIRGEEEFRILHRMTREYIDGRGRDNGWGRRRAFGVVPHVLDTADAPIFANHELRHHRLRKQGYELGIEGSNRLQRRVLGLHRTDGNAGAVALAPEPHVGISHRTDRLIRAARNGVSRLRQTGHLHRIFLARELYRHTLRLRRDDLVAVARRNALHRILVPIRKPDAELLLILAVGRHPDGPLGLAVVLLEFVVREWPVHPHAVRGVDVEVVGHEARCRAQPVERRASQLAQVGRPECLRSHLHLVSHEVRRTMHDLEDVRVVRRRRTRVVRVG